MEHRVPGMDCALRKRRGLFRHRGTLTSVLSAPIFPLNTLYFHRAEGLFTSLPVLDWSRKVTVMARTQHS